MNFVDIQQKLLEECLRKIPPPTHKPYIKKLKPHAWEISNGSLMLWTGDGGKKDIETAFKENEVEYDLI